MRTASTRDRKRRLQLRTAGFGAAVLLFVSMAAAQTPPNTHLAVTGDVAAPLTLSVSDLDALPQQRVQLTGEDGEKTVYEGVTLQAILQKAGVPMSQIRGKFMAGYVLAVARDGYEVVFGLGELSPSSGNARVIVADTMITAQGQKKPLFDYQGPFRLVLPGDGKEARSLRMLETLKVVLLRK